MGYHDRGLTLKSIPQHYLKSSDHASLQLRYQESAPNTALTTPQTQRPSDWLAHLIAAYLAWIATICTKQRDAFHHRKVGLFWRPKVVNEGHRRQCLAASLNRRHWQQ